MLALKQRILPATRNQGYVYNRDCERGLLKLFGLLILGFFFLVSVGAALDYNCDFNDYCCTIDEAYAFYSGADGILGEPTSEIMATADGIGQYQNFEYGSIYWSPDTCAQEIHGAIRDEYQSLGWEQSVLGYPTSDTNKIQTGVLSGYFQKFQQGQIVWTSSTGAHEIHGPIFDKWRELYWWEGYVGYPETDVMTTHNGNGYVSYFDSGIQQGGVIYYYPGSNPYVVRDSETSDMEITHWQVGSNIDMYRIDRPRVNQPLTEYPEVKFAPHDRVTIEAGGCVNRRGLIGDTWRRYVNPFDSDSDTLYHGTVYIPGAIQGETWLQSIVHEPFDIPTPPADHPEWLDQLYLRLGYLDDNYTDYGGNGYSDHDDGEVAQCANVGPAWVTVKIEHNAATGETKPHLPLDLVWTTTDDNWLPLNPAWGYQWNTPHVDPEYVVKTVNEVCDDTDDVCYWTDPYDPVNGEKIAYACPGVSLDTCTNQQLSRDSADGLYGLICDIGYEESGFGQGHVNWFAATTQGTIYKDVPLSWVAHSAEGTDDDYNFKVQPSDLAGVVGGGDSIKIEFDADETANEFNSPWWKEYREMVDLQDTGGPTFPPHIIDGSYAIVTGLIGLDTEHDAHPELHPAWAMAIRDNSVVPTGNQDPDTEVWAMFVRNWGNEGYCSRYQHYLDLMDNTYTFRLPWRMGATSVEVLYDQAASPWGGTQFQSNDGQAQWTRFSYTPGEGVLVSFKMSPPHEGGTRVNGQLVLHWDPPSTQGTQAINKGGTIKTMQAEEEGEEKEANVEYHLWTLQKQMTPEQLEIFRATLPPNNMEPDTIDLQNPEPILLTHLPQMDGLLPGQSQLFPSLVDNTDLAVAKRARDDGNGNAWIAAFGSQEAFFDAFRGIVAETLASRTIEDPNLLAGESTIVQIDLTSNIEQGELLREFIPAGWTLTPISNDETDSFDSDHNIWTWVEVDGGSTHSVTYQLKVPSDASPGVYTLDGYYHTYGGLTGPITGDNTITVSAEIDGMKWEDLNANKIKDADETALSGWNITLTGQDNKGAAVKMTTTTDAAGNYSFKNLSGGVYTVSEQVKNGWIQTFPAPPTYSITITTGSIIGSKDFGNFKKGLITAGGNITAESGKYINFGLTGQYDSKKGTPKGSLEYQDSDKKLNIKSYQISTVASTTDKKRGVMTGLATVNGKGAYPFEAYIEDIAEPGVGHDSMKLVLPTYPYTRGGILIGGNVQIK